MKQRFLLLACIIVGTTLCAQQRTERPPFTFDAASDTITQVSGWYYNDFKGTWTENINIICNLNMTKVPPPYPSTFYSHGRGFCQLFCLFAYCNNKRYYFLVVDKTAREPYNGKMLTIPSYDIYLIPASEYQKLYNITAETEILCLSDYYSQGITDIPNTCRKMIQQRNLTQYKWLLRPTAADDSVQFLLPSTAPTWNVGYFETTTANFNKIILL